MPYKIAILGTATYKEPDNKSEVALAELGTANPMTDANWLKIEIAGMSPQFEFLEEPQLATGGISIHNPAQYGLFNVQLPPLYFPNDMAKYFAIMDVLNFPHLYLYRGEYDFDPVIPNPALTPWNIHSDNKCLKVVATANYSDEYRDAVKIITLQLKKEMPKLYE